MTVEEAEEFLKYYDDKIPDPLHHPKMFRLYVLMWRQSKK